VSSPYDDILMEHIRNARNYRVPDGPSESANGANALCGDAMTVFVRMADGRIADVAFQCECCGVSMASASIMTELIIGATTEEARARLKSFIARIGNRDDAGTAGENPGQNSVVAVVRQYPVRSRCAMLPWLTLEAALDRRSETLYVR